MASIPFNNNFQYLQTYVGLYVVGNMCYVVPFVDSTGAPYQPGLLVAAYTSGPNAGSFGDYASAGSNGQATCVGVLVDQNIPYGTDGGFLALVRFAGPIGFQASKLSATGGSGDITTGMGQIGARYIAPLAMWYLP